MRKIGIFVGTFNPLHFGHIHMALALKESKGLDEVFFSPNHTSPFPKEGMLATPMQRLEMVRVGLEGVPGCSALDYEVKKIGPSYTIDLIRHVRSSLCNPEDQIFLLLGEDLIQGFSKWKEKDELLSMVQPLIGSRKTLDQKTILDPQFESGRVLMPVLEISSSLVRERIKKCLYCGHLVPQKVLDYILSNKLYS